MENHDTQMTNDVAIIQATTFFGALVTYVMPVISMIFMMIFSRHVSEFINKHDGMKVIALAFLLVIGFILTAEGIIDCYNFSVSKLEHLHLNKNYAYAGLSFALLVEYFNIKEKNIRKKKDVDLR